MRRKIRGLYSGAGKGDSTRLELNFIREEDGDESIFERPNHESCLQLVKGFINLAKNKWISEDTAHPYPAKYSDEHEYRPIFEVDSHQADANGKEGKRYTELTPCKFFVEANQIADNFCSLGLCTIENDYFDDQDTPNNVTCPLQSLDFYYEHDGKTFHGDTSTDVAKRCDLEMRNRSANRPKHGAAIRPLEKWSFNPTSIRRNSIKRRMIFGIANAG